MIVGKKNKENTEEAEKKAWKESKWVSSHIPNTPNLHHHSQLNQPTNLRFIFYMHHCLTRGKPYDDEETKSKRTRERPWVSNISHLWNLKALHQTERTTTYVLSPFLLMMNCFQILAKVLTRKPVTNNWSRSISAYESQS